MSQVTVRVSCFPTEDPEKVKQAILNIFPGSEFEIGETGFFAKTTSLEKFKEVLLDLRILDTARNRLLKGREGNRTSFSLNKQVAYVGKVSFVEERLALGSIDVVIDDVELDAVIDDIAPKTINGEIP
jgi:predicted RNA binding protein with dsRBD fold (UPF0201 family)